jgi:hypothetical protein
MLAKGIVSYSLSKDDEAMDCFLDCIADQDEFDNRVIKNCLNRISKIINKKALQNPFYKSHLVPINKILSNYIPKQKDVVLIVNQQVRSKSTLDYPIEKKI